MPRDVANIEREIRALSRNDQVCLLRSLLDELEALPYTMSPRVLRVEIDMDVAASNDYVATHGSFADMAREHYAAGGDDAV